jgi:hypothetical protein
MWALVKKNDIACKKWLPRANIFQLLIEKKEEILTAFEKKINFVARGWNLISIMQFGAMTKQSFFHVLLFAKN